MEKEDGLLCSTKNFQHICFQVYVFQYGLLRVRSMNKYMTSLISASVERDSEVSLVGFLEDKMVRCLELLNRVIDLSAFKTIKLP